MVNVISLVLVGISFCIVVQMLRVYPSKSTPFYVYFFVFIGWLLPFVTIALIPYDVYLTLSNDGSKSLLYTSWEILYWVIFAFCWVILPLMKNFMTAGEFTIFTKLRSAFVGRAKYLLALICLLVVFIIYLAVVKHLGITSIQAFLIAMGNVWGLLLIMILMGYGVVAIPKMWWYKGNYVRSLDYFRLKAVQIDEKKSNAGYELNQCILKAIAFEKRTKNDTDLNMFVKQILRLCSEEEIDALRTRNFNLSPDQEINIKTITELNARVKYLKSEKLRVQCRWDNLLLQAFHLEDIIVNKNNKEKHIRSCFWPQKTGKLSRTREVLEWWWYAKAFPIVTKIISVLFAMLSILVILGESTLFIDAPAGLFPLFFKSSHGDAGTQILCLLPMIYIFSVTYIGLFTLRIDGSYGLYNKNHTDPANLVWSAFFCSRLVHPLIYNFLLFIKVDHTQFHKVMGVMDIVPIFGSAFCLYFPLSIVLFAVLNALDFYTWLMVKIGFPQLSFAEDFDREKMKEGRALLKKSRASKEKEYEAEVIIDPDKALSENKSGTSKFDVIKKREGMNAPLIKP